LTGEISRTGDWLFAAEGAGDSPAAAEQRERKHRKQLQALVVH